MQTILAGKQQPDILDDFTYLESMPSIETRSSLAPSDNCGLSIMTSKNIVGGQDATLGQVTLSMERFFLFVFTLLLYSTRGWSTLATSTDPTQSCCTSAGEHLWGAGSCRHHDHHDHHCDHYPHIKMGLDRGPLCDPTASQLQAPRHT